jgi:hypothetical protein
MMKATLHIMVWVLGALWLVGCTTYAELPGGKTYGVVTVAEDRSPFGTNVSFPALMECTKRISHWYKPDEFPREHCTYMKDERSNKVAEATHVEPKANPQAFVAPAVKQTVVTPVKHVTTRPVAKRAVRKPSHAFVAAAPSRINLDPMLGLLLVDSPDPAPREYFQFAQSRGGGYDALAGAFIGTGIGVAGALLRPSNVTQNNTMDVRASTVNPPLPPIKK